MQDSTKQCVCPMQGRSWSKHYCVQHRVCVGLCPLLCMGSIGEEVGDRTAGARCHAATIVFVLMLRSSRVDDSI
jgi:hypothetical protein